MVGILKQYLGHQSKIVVVPAMQALAELAEQHPALISDMVEAIRHPAHTGSPAMRARGDKLLNRLQRITY